MNSKVDNELTLNAITKWTEQFPERLVYKTKERNYTYGELGQQSNKIAHYVQSMVATSKPIVIFGDLQFEMVAAFVGVSKAGLPYIPISSDTPPDRLQLILQTAEPALIIRVNTDTDKELDYAIPQVTYDELMQFDGTIETKFTGVQPDDTYYIIFTSGTTGVPKGVQISHANLSRFVHWMLTDFDLRDGSTYLAQAAYSFDLSVMGLYPALASGSILAPLKKEETVNFKQLFTRLPELSLENWISTPSFIDICLMEPLFDAEHYPTISHFLFCGEELTHATATLLSERFPQAKIFNTYGPTEATVAISGVEITKDILDTYKRLPIGYVKSDTRVIIDEQSKEINIVGPTVSKGYLNNAEKTKEAFFEFEGQPAYHTGDAGSLDENGLLFYEGRIDFQVKLHGYRIELEEVEHHLSQCPYVKQAIVIPKWQDHKVQQLVAVVIPENSPFEKPFQLTKAIREAASQTLMDYMVPKRFVYKETFPMTQNGKVDRKALHAEVNQ